MYGSPIRRRTSSGTFAQIRPPASLRSVRITVGVTNCEATAMSVSSSLPSASYTRTVPPCCRASSAPLIETPTCATMPGVRINFLVITINLVAPSGIAEANSYSRYRVRTPMLEPAACRKVDRSGMLNIVESLPEQLSDGYRGAESIQIEAGDVSRVFIAGMGGSAIAGDIFVSWAADRSKIGLEVVRGYSLPPTAAPNDLLIALSYSGDTEETLAPGHDGGKKGV